MGAILIRKSGIHRGQKEHLSKGVTRLGRKSDNHMIFAEPEVSSYHAQIRAHSNTYTLIDLESTNGTYVNGSRLNKTVLHNKDRVQLGKNGPLLEFRTDDIERVDFPKIVPISGRWKQGKNPIKLIKGKTSLGRGEENDIVVGQSHDPVVSTKHAEIRVHSDSCTLKDLDSTNGTYINDRRIRRASLHDGDRVELGRNGPEFDFHWKKERASHKHSRSAGSDRMFRKLIDAAKNGRAGEQTMMILNAAHRYYKRRRWPLLIMAIAGLAGCIAAGIFGFHMMSKYRQLTQLNNFYEMRRSQMALVAQHDSLSATEKRSLRDKRLRLLAEYEKYLEKVDWYTQKSPKEKAVMRLARNLGETSLEVPQDFIAKALEGVEKWKSTSRLARDLAHAREQNLIARIRSVLDQYDLPREFVFIALQESDFEPKAVGPETNFGIAKGMWQLMPPTASDYGLKIGPLKDSREYDPMDERHIADLSTQAAAKHLAFLYSSKAAASGLLVIASYNYGQTRIIKKLDSLPNEPSQRNFWNFYRHGWVPDETQKYVMSIFSAALLCENPALFGFDSEAIDKYW